MCDEDNIDDTDWFDKDEDELLQGVQCKIDKSDGNNRSPVEFITVPSASEAYLKQKSLEASTSSQPADRINITLLRQISKMDPLDAFLYCISWEPNFFEGQINLGDSQERVLLYLQTLRILCDLELPGFHKDVLRSLMNNDDLLEHFCILTTKMFSKRHKNLWKNDDRTREIVDNMRALLWQSFQNGEVSAKGKCVIRRLQRIIAAGESPLVVNLPICVQFGEQLNQMIQRMAGVESQEVEATKGIYPTLDELVQEYSESRLRKRVSQDDRENVHDYVARQMHLLREDFLTPLRDCIQLLRTRPTESLEFLSEGNRLFKDVRIVLNERFLTAGRNELLFVDFLGSERESERRERTMNGLREDLRRIKTGAMLCLTSGSAFENLILAVVTHTDGETLREGYIAIDIVRQYNVGDIYSKSFLLFETPAFFEPYHNVYSYLSSCSLTPFPMQQYIVGGETNVGAPSYLKQDAVYTFDDGKFKPLHAAAVSPLPGQLPLNPSQQMAFRRALTQEFCLVQGPPGTGKTHLSVHLMRTLIENALTTPIVLITYTNESLDKFLMKLSAYTQSIVRFGYQVRLPEIAQFNIGNRIDEGYMVNPRLKRLYYATDLQYKEKFEALQKRQQQFDGSEESYQSILAAQRELREITLKLNGIRAMFQYYVAREQKVIAMTTTCAAKMNFLFRLLKSSIVIFEEAAEILESHVLACLTPHTEHVIMIGDHMQLQPYTMSYRYGKDHQMNVSLFERLFKQNLPVNVLNVQYRMQPDIAALITPSIYKEMDNAEIVGNYPPVRGMRQSLFFYTHSQMESKSKDESSLYNSYEVEKVVKLVGHLIEKVGYSPADVVVLSPYARQILLIKNALGKNVKLDGVKASTVDSFQGLEANIVVLSLVRSNTQGGIGFLSATNRICVALSRAKHAMYAICNLNWIAANSSTWNSVREKLIAQDAVGDEFPYAPDYDSNSD